VDAKKGGSDLRRLDHQANDQRERGWHPGRATIATSTVPSLTTESKREGTVGGKENRLRKKKVKGGEGGHSK